MTNSIPEGYVEAFTKRGFALTEKIGSGGSGNVFRATQLSLDRDVAIKVFDHRLNEGDTKLRTRFEQEARMLARIRHPSIPVVLTRGAVTISTRELPYTAMQFIGGVSLEALIHSERRIPLARAVNYATQVLAALGAAHAQRIVHRDVKPANIMIEQNTAHVYLIDFSIGVSLDSAKGLTRVTADGNQPGSFQYMAPEQKQGSNLDCTADLYAFGVVLFEMLTGNERVNLATWTLI